MSPFRHSSLLFGLILAMSVAACASPQAASTRTDDPFAERADQDVLLTVQNNDFRDATIYAYWNGVKTRLGMVVGKTSETFRMRWRSEEVQLEVDFVGRGTFRTERIDVWAGDHLDFVIPVR